MQSNLETYSPPNYTDELLQKVDALSCTDIDDLFTTNAQIGHESQFGLLELALNVKGFAGCENVGNAAIATTLYPKVDEHLKSGSAIYVIGNDGPNISQQDYPWKEQLCSWLKRGVDVNYLLINPTNEAVSSIKEIKNQFNNTPGSIHAWRVKADVSENLTDSADHAWIERFKTTHFAAFTQPSMLWLEAEHKADTTEAQGCVFYSEDSEFGATVGTTLIDRFRSLTTQSETSEEIV